MSGLRRPFRTWTVIVLVIPTALLTACGPPDAGVMGVTVDSNGRPIGVLEVCTGHIDGATLYETSADEPDESAPTHAVLGDWSASPAVTSSSRLDLTKPTGVWQAKTPLLALRPGRSYTLSGWTTDNSWSAGRVDFSREDLKSLQPGQVRYDAGPGPDDNDRPDTTTTVPITEFRSKVCA